MRKKSIETTLLDKLERIDTNKEKGKITQRQHDTQSRDAVRDAFRKVAKK